MSDVWGSVEEYQNALKSHSAAKKGKHDLVELDEWFRGELRAAVQSRTPKYITKEELISVVKWKLSRGTWRPKLVSYAEEHTSSKVKDVTTAAFKCVGTGHIKEAMVKLMDLKGMGAATSSAVLSAAYPNLPYMSDELLLEVYGKKEYTLKAYMALFEKVHTVVPAGMSVEVYECVLWAHAHTGVAGEKLTTPNLMNSNTSTRSRKRKR